MTCYSCYQSPCCCPTRCGTCYSNPCCCPPCSTLPCNIVIRDYNTCCPQKCYQVYVPPKTNIFQGTYVPGHYEVICEDGYTPEPHPQPQPHPQPHPHPHPHPHPQPQPNLIGGCAGTRYSCCPDGITAKADQQGSNCAKIGPCYSSCPYKCHDECIHYKLRQSVNQPH